jgi:hypothetical protein
LFSADLWRVVKGNQGPFLPDKVVDLAPVCTYSKKTSTAHRGSYLDIAIAKGLF